MQIGISLFAFCFKLIFVSILEKLSSFKIPSSTFELKVNSWMGGDRIVAYMQFFVPS